MAMEFCAPAPENAQVLTAAAVAELVGGRVSGDSGVTVGRVNSLAAAAEGEATFFTGGGPASTSNAADLAELENSRASLILAADAVPTPAPATVRVANPALAAALLAQHFDLARPRWCGIHELSNVHASARIGDGVSLHARVHVDADCVIGAGCVLHPGVVLYPGTRLGPGCTIHANSVLGADGFGYIWSGERHEKVPQQGWVEIGAGVEIGAQVAIDRGTFAATRVGAGCIIDNQVQIGHNCELGRLVVLCAQVGLAGSTVIGDGAVLGGRAATTGHLRIGSGAQMAGNAVATKDIADGMVVGGYPAWDLRMEKRMIARIRRLARAGA